MLEVRLPHVALNNHVAVVLSQGSIDINLPNLHKITVVNSVTCRRLH